MIQDAIREMVNVVYSHLLMTQRNIQNVRRMFLPLLMATHGVQQYWMPATVGEMREQLGVIANQIVKFEQPCVKKFVLSSTEKLILMFL